MQSSISDIEQEFTTSCKLMGNSFSFTVLAADKSFADACMEKAIVEVRRIEALFSTYQPGSQVNQVNDAAGIKAVAVDEEVYNLTERSLRISRLTDGAFDLSYGSIDKRLWNFDQTMRSLPGREQAKKMVRLIDYRKIILDPVAKTIFLQDIGMRIGFGGIGKGYAADAAAALLQQLGIRSGLVNASGDIKAWGAQTDGLPWKIGISHPDNRLLPLAWLSLNNNAIATSGNYEKFVCIKGKKYSHTINPITGMPATGIKSVTVIAPNAELADAMATPVTIMGTKAGINLLDQLPGFAGIIIDDNDKIFSTKNIQLQ
ncbi:MAG: FAD:protein FMN transferase [Chitinophagaceae bacterium]|nr:MAG: FAD:protein FMN transferase [Chitinophagaceae bacterium]